MFSRTRCENDSVTTYTMEAIRLQLKVQEIHDDLQDLAAETGYPIGYVNNCNQRIFGPPPNYPNSPSHGAEVFVSRLPKDTYENELFRFFTKVGKIYMIRIMITPSKIHNKGFAFVTFFTPEEAQQCVRILRNIEFRRNWYLTIEKSLDNNRIFIGGIPDFKTKDQVWHELLRNGMTGITDIIMYRSYTDRNKNRGFVFVEFKNHQEAAQTRVLFKNMLLWGERVHVDWSSPLPDVEPRVMSQVKKLFIRNLDITQSKLSLEKVIKDVLGGISLERVYKFKDYAFVHFTTRRDAQRALQLLNEMYRHTDIEVTWAIPPKYRPKQMYRTSRSSINVNSQKGDEAACRTPTLEDTFTSARHLQLQNCEAYFNTEDIAKNDEILKMMRHLGIDD